MCFYYIFEIINDCCALQFDKCLVIGKYYLVDAGYPTFIGYLGPYKGERYHLPQFRNGPRVRGRIEVFKYLHSSLRSIIERSFGCCKARWKILGNMPSFPLATQIQIIVACMALHNFIRRHDKDDDVFTNFEMEENDAIEIGPNNVTGDGPTQESVRQMEQIRDYIKNQMPTRI